MSPEGQRRRFSNLQPYEGKLLKPIGEKWIWEKEAVMLNDPLHSIPAVVFVKIGELDHNGKAATEGGWY